MGEPDDKTDFMMYNAIKQGVLSGGLNHIDCAPNYRYMKSERTVGKALTVLQNKYDISRNMMFVTSKAGYVPENAEDFVTQPEMIADLVENHGVPEDAF